MSGPTLTRRAAAFALAATTGAAKSEIRYFHYGDWTAVIDVFDTEDERRTVCTAKTGGDGLPIGVQIVGAKGRDTEVLRAAQWLFDWNASGRG